MLAALFHQHGAPDVLRLEEIATPVPGRGQVLIRVHAAAMNHLDLWVRRGLPIEIEMPHIGGSDFAGVVAGLGEEVESLAIGQRVVVNPTLFCGLCRDCRRGEEALCRSFRIQGEHTNGGFAEYVVSDARNVYPVPDEVSLETAACLPVSYQTAWRAIVSRAEVKPGEEVLVLGASGGTAIAAIQVALLAGARVYAVTSGDENVARVAALGAERVYDRERVDFSKEVYRDTGKRGVDVVVENVGAATWQGSLRALAPAGRLVTFGATAGPKAEIDLRRLFWLQLQIIGTTMASRGEFEAMLRAAWMGRLVPVIDRRFPLQEIRAAHERLEAGDQFGKIIVTVDD